MVRMAALHEVCLEITHDCPARCVHCSSAHQGCGAAPLDTNALLRVLREVAELGASIVELSGGEPLLHSDLFALIGYAKRLDLESRLYTSGLAVGTDGAVQGISRRLAHRLRKAGLAKIVFNLQGASARVHDPISGVAGSFDLALNGLRNAKREGLWVGIHFVPMNPNARELRPLLELGASAGVDEVAVLRFVAQGRGAGNRHWLQLSSQKFGSFVQLASDLATEYQGFLRLGSPMNFCSFLSQAVPSTQCAAGVSTLTILPDGRVIPCPAFKGMAEYVAGSVQQESLTDIWVRSHVWTPFRTFTAEQLRGPCTDCDHLASCRGRCTAQRIRAWGDMFQGPDPGCTRDAPEAISQGTLAEVESARTTVVTPGRQAVGALAGKLPGVQDP